MIITYADGQEIIICTLEKEHQVIKDYFTDGGRDLEDFTRDEHPTDILSTEIHSKVAIYN